MIMDIHERKVFPCFDRALYNLPEKLFEGWDYVDFMALIGEYSDGSEKPDVSGWVNQNKYSRPFQGWLGNDNGMFGMWDMRFRAVTSGYIEITPSLIDKFLFPYTIQVNDSNVVNFANQDSYSVPTMRAMLNTDLCLSKALLLEGFTGGIKSEPRGFTDARLLSVDEVLDSQVLELDVPYDVLEDSLFSLAGGSANKKSISGERQILLSYANMIYRTDFDV